MLVALGLADLDVTAPASSNVLGTVLDFAPVVAAEPWLWWQPGQVASQPLGVCVADPWWWKCRLTVTRVPSCQGSGCLHVGARELAEGADGMGFENPPNACLHPGQA